ncbi:uncharacterized protein LOC132032176 [Lycium ferocissimum]|uniref:uncharacterized protein LOC132032176 n=1 Tax=Lycium ferocissimum TaxID=112874 RepID=UPI0028166FFD|nr:uncharacterized protein LOC132032176 [Lycium ferocissimum]
MIQHPESSHIDPPEIGLKEEHAYCSHVEAEPYGKLWYNDIKLYLEEQEYPEGITNSQKKIIRRMANGFFPNKEILYKRTPDLGLLRCVDVVEATKLLEEKCHQCQIHGDLINVPPSELSTMSSPWSFVAWVMDVIRPIEPAASNGHLFILVAIDYFTEWVEATSHKLVTKKKQFKITHRNSMAYRPQMNGAVEAANKNIKRILRKMTNNCKGWHEQLPHALLGYRTTARASIEKTPYLLVYSTEAVIPIEVEIPLLIIIQEVELDNAKWVRARYEQLALIDEKRMIAVCHGQLYRQRMARAFNKRVRARLFQIRQMVLKRIFPHQDEYKGKFAPNWQGSCVVRKVLSGRAVVLAEMDGQEWPKPINSDAIKRYYT